MKKNLRPIILTFDVDDFLAHVTFRSSYVHLYLFGSKCALETWQCGRQRPLAAHDHNTRISVCRCILNFSPSSRPVCGCIIKPHYSADNGAMKWRTSHTQKSVLMPLWCTYFRPKRVRRERMRWAKREMIMLISTCCGCCLPRWAYNTQKAHGLPHIFSQQRRRAHYIKGEAAEHIRLLEYTYLKGVVCVCLLFRKVHRWVTIFGCHHPFVGGSLCDLSRGASPAKRVRRRRSQAKIHLKY